jgi:hypothetical protein
VSDESKAGKGGGLCCDYCADSKFPCVFMEKKMRRESKKTATEEKSKVEGVQIKTEG